ncbi:hypothetical protein PSNTI_06820 [Stutzerimonas stutzeri]|nr:hypothetical protein AB691_0612 [Stutzerimonas stutzeri]GBC55232.1 hypothetical protein PSNTI_06820 [Stutzerimonas stutzeri]
MQNPDILTRSTPSANAVIAAAACSGTGARRPPTGLQLSVRTQ